MESFHGGGSPFSAAPVISTLGTEGRRAGFARKKRECGENHAHVRARDSVRGEANLEYSALWHELCVKEFAGGGGAGAAAPRGAPNRSARSPLHDASKAHVSGECAEAGVEPR